MTEAAVQADGLYKRYGQTHALRGIDLTVSVGTVCGLLGPNGAGKTTVVRILTTLAVPDAGRARVAATTWFAIPTRSGIALGWPASMPRSTRSWPAATT
jgi:ABC-2 type transport system ATP-binding protein